MKNPYIIAILFITTLSAIFAYQQGEIVNKLDTIRQLDEVILKANTILATNMWQEIEQGLFIYYRQKI